MEKLKRYDLNCNIFDVYDYDGLSMQELLCQFYTKINECVDFSNSTLNLCSWLVNEGLKEEVAEKLIKWLNDGTLENVINVNLFNTLHTKIENIEENLTYLNVVNHGAKGDGIQDDSQYIQEVLNKGGNVYIPKGKYLINKTLILKEGTHLLMDKNAILYNNIHQSQDKGLKCVAILSNYDVDYTVNGYNLASNIKITGGTLVGVRNDDEKQILTDLGDIGQSGISLSHGKNIIIENVCIKDTFRGHGIEITGCENVVVDNCIVDGCILTDIDVTRVKEAIQIEHSGTSGGYVGTSPSMQDNTLSKNITVKNCSIIRTNLNSQKWGSGIGSHNNDNTSVMENITIENNKIYDCLHAGIMLINYKNSKIKNNIIEGSDWGIGYYQSRALANVTISDNTIENIAKGGVSISDGAFGLTIENNRFANIDGVGISLVDATNLFINNNKFLNCGINGTVDGVIQVYGIKQSDISNNYMYKTVDSTVKRGIFIGGTSDYQNYNVTYSNNKIEFECSEEDIYLHNTARSTNSNILFNGEFTISNNTSKNLDKSVYQYNALRIETTFGNTIVPVSDGSIKTIICDIGQGSNALTVIEFTMTLDSLGKNITMTGCRYMSIGNSSQSTQDLTSGLKINITKIIGI